MKMPLALPWASEVKSTFRLPQAPSEVQGFGVTTRVMLCFGSVFTVMTLAESACDIAVTLVDSEELQSEKCPAVSVLWKSQCVN